MINVFIVGSKGIPARYGGFETFVENLTKRKQDPSIHYYVSCMGGNKEFIYNDSTCFSIPVKIKGPAGRILNVSKALSWTEKRIKASLSAETNIVYVLGCRIGPLLKKHVRELHKLGCLILCNPDGLEWKRGKWNRFEKVVLKFCEKELVKYSDFVICDSIGIQDYILSEYPFLNKQDTTYLSYGCDFTPSSADANAVSLWLQNHGISSNGYYLVVGRFVPENNIELIIREFMASHTNKDLVLITNVANNKFFRKLHRKLHFESDERIKFVGTLYDAEELKMVRQKAFAYIHGHSVGGTNPSLLEAMSQTHINLLYDVNFNREVGEEQALYFTSEKNSLASLIDSIELKKPEMDPLEIVKKRYSWPDLVNRYEKCFRDVSKREDLLK